jgi:hypothetical protein
LLLSSGQVWSWNAAQWTQVIEAYSTIVTLAPGEPCTRSGNGPIDINCSIGTITGGATTATAGGVNEGLGFVVGASLGAVGVGDAD